MKTVQVSKRGCGWPKEGGFYAMGGGRAMTCFALPVELKTCVCCMQMPKQARCPTKVTHEYMEQMFYGIGMTACSERCRQCIHKDTTYWISWIGSDYTKKEFCQEVNEQGLSRRIPPSFTKLIQPGDIMANVKGGEIMNLVPITSVRYYVKPSDDAKKIAELEKDGIEVCKIEKVEHVGEQVEITEQ